MTARHQTSRFQALQDLAAGLSSQPGLPLAAGRITLRGSKAALMLIRPICPGPRWSWNQSSQVLQEDVCRQGFEVLAAARGDGRLIHRGIQDLSSKA